MEKNNSRPVFQVFILWASLRVLTSLAAAVFSLLSNHSAEETTRTWLQEETTAGMLQGALVDPWLHWDASRFNKILVNGYQAGNGSTNFHPLYTWSSLPLYKLGIDPTLSLLFTSSLAAFLFLMVFYRLAIMDLGDENGKNALLFLAFFPLAFILFAPYTESLFLLWATLTLLALRNRRWGLVAMAAFLATLTRQQGVFLALPIAWEAWQATRQQSAGIKKNWAAWLSTLAAPLGMLAWVVYRMGILGEGSLDFSNLQAFIYSALLSPSSELVFPGQSIQWPWVALVKAVSQAIHATNINDIINLVFGLGFVLAFILAWKHLRPAERIYSLAIFLVSFSFCTEKYAYISLPRHLFLAFPVFIGLAGALRKPWVRYILPVISFIGMMELVMYYVLEGWIP